MEVRPIEKPWKKKASQPSTVRRFNGKKYEILACKYLRRKKLKILRRNVFIGKKEIDIIAFDKKAQIYWLVEVRGRANKKFRPRQMISQRKLDYLRYCARWLRFPKTKLVLVEVTGELPQNRVLWLMRYLLDFYFFRYEPLDFS